MLNDCMASQLLSEIKVDISGPTEDTSEHVQYLFPNLTLEATIRKGMILASENDKRERLRTDLSVLGALRG
jgi:hypothetical protein